MPEDNDIELPTVHDAIVDRDTVEQLFFDIANAAELREVLIKTHATRMADRGETSLDSARTAIVQGAAAAVQIRYRHAAIEWLDTILKTSAGYRIVRIQAFANDGPDGK